MKETRKTRKLFACIQCFHTSSLSLKAKSADYVVVISALQFFYSLPQLMQLLL
ncbi:hypothetical protein HMPREF9445_00439 [Bacteroides clarus YIT 12056]|uniref:Uncharacterized protein n=1 Tax=Bacteroides clarus YIT 12056 TaxID=762984 RepID=A0ABN0CS63_9BACE|nr:hypothetical protein HMPREF9445_00439 [Bacteroides clarus YIT 12056]